MRVLVIEDNRDLVANLFDYLEPRGHIVDAAPDGRTGLHLATTQPYDLVVLDWMLPRLDGPGVLAALRDEFASNVPVIMLTARDELPDKIAGFRAGADDYLTKPFALPELEVRMVALLARSQGKDRRKVLEISDLRYDQSTLEVTRAGRALHLYPACRRLLQELMQASPGAVTRERLEYVLWGDNPPDGDMLRSHIYELRRSVDAGFPVKLIHTLPRIGYRLAGSATEEHGDAGRKT